MPATSAGVVGAAWQLVSYDLTSATAGPEPAAVVSEYLRRALADATVASYRAWCDYVRTLLDLFGVDGLRHRMQEVRVLAALDFDPFVEQIVRGQQTLTDAFRSELANTSRPLTDAERGGGCDGSPV